MNKINDIVIVERSDFGYIAIGKVTRVSVNNGVRVKLLGRTYFDKFSTLAESGAAVICYTKLELYK